MRAIKKKDPVVLGLILSSILFLPIEAYFRWGWDPYQGRYFIAAAGQLASLIYLLINDRPVSKVYRWIGAVVILMSFAFITFYNPTKPLTSNDVKIFSADRIKLQSLAGDSTLWRFTYMVNRSIPEDAVIAYYAPNLIYDYTLFGEHFTRRVIQIIDPQQLTNVEWLKAWGVQYVLIDESLTNPPTVAGKLVPFDEVKGSWLMYTWSKVK